MEVRIMLRKDKKENGLERHGMDKKRMNLEEKTEKKLLPLE